MNILLETAVTDERSRDLWTKHGALDTWMRARKIAKGILAAEEKTYLPNEADRTIRKKYEILI